MILSEHSLFARDVTDALEGTGLSVHEAFAANEIPPMPCGGGNALRETVRSNARVVYAGADMVTHLTERLRDTAISLGLDMAKSVILPNAIDGRTYRIRHVPRDAWTRPPQLVLLGRVVPVKGVTAAIECARQLHSTGFPFQLRIIGPRDEVPCYAARCERMVRDFRLSEFVKFVPPMPPERALLGADFLLLPSLSEAMPMVVLEAMAAGVPVIATDTGNVREMLGLGTDGPAGIVTSLANFANAIFELNQDKTAWERMILNGPARIARYHDIRMVASRWARIYSGSGMSPDIFTKSAPTAERLPPITN
jgi:glycosyltransferase involved in cell wall biosynthesis